MDEIAIIDERTLTDKIYEVRGVKVMLDFELAEIYGYETKTFNQQIKRNKEKFPDDFMFQLTDFEIKNLRSQNVTSSWGGTRYLPYAFTEQGIYMLMTVLKGELATQQSIALIRTFRVMKDYIAQNQQLLPYDVLKDLELRQYKLSERVDKVEEGMVKKTDLSKLMKLFDEGVNSESILILGGQPFKADIAFQRIYSKAKESIVVVDNYIGPKTLLHLVHARPGVKITVISDNKGYHPLRESEYKDFVSEYPESEIRFVKARNKTHDRQIFVDFGTKNEKMYFCGTSSKDAGKKITVIMNVKKSDVYRGFVDELLAGPVLKLK